MGPSDSRIRARRPRIKASGGGGAMLAVGEAEGPGRVIRAAKKTMALALSEGVDFRAAKEFIVSIRSSRGMRMAEMKAAMDFFKKAARADAKVMMGHVYDESLGALVRVTLTARG